MTRYHMGRNGKPEICNPVVTGVCGLQDEDPIHGGSINEVYALMAEKYSDRLIPQPLTKQAPTPDAFRESVIGSGFLKSYTGVKADQLKAACDEARTAKQVADKEFTALRSDVIFIRQQYEEGALKGHLPSVEDLKALEALEQELQTCRRRTLLAKQALALTELRLLNEASAVQ